MDTKRPASEQQVDHDSPRGPRPDFGKRQRSRHPFQWRTAQPERSRRRECGTAGRFRELEADPFHATLQNISSRLLQRRFHGHVVSHGAGLARTRKNRSAELVSAEIHSISKNFPGRFVTRVKGAAAFVPEKIS